MLALGTFLEEKTALQKPDRDMEESSSTSEAHNEPADSWPSATLTTANLVVGLLSAIVGSAVTFSVTRQSHAVDPKKGMFHQSKPIVTHVHESPYRANNETAESPPGDDVSILIAPLDNRSQASAWVRDFSTAQVQFLGTRENVTRQHDTSKFQPDNWNFWASGQSNKLSELDTG